RAADGVRRREGRHADRAGGNLRPGDFRHSLHRHRRGDRARQQDQFRSRQWALDARRDQGAQARARHSRGFRLDQLLPGDGPGGAVRRLQDERLRTREWQAARRGIPQREGGLDQDRLTRRVADIGGAPPSGYGGAGPDAGPARLTPGTAVSETHMRRLFLVLGLLAFLVPSAAWAQQLTMFAAASLTDALKDVSAAWEKQGHPPLRLSFASSSTLARQIAEGAPANLFASADEKWM